MASARGRSVSSQSRSRSVSSSKHSVRETELPEPRVVGSRTSSVASLSSLRSAGDQAQDVPKATKPEESPSVEETPQKVELVDPVSSTSPSGTDGASSSAVPPPEVQASSSQSSDPLQVAAQLYPWLYMNSTLEACFKDAEAAAKKDLENRAKELSTEEADIADQRARFDSERAIEFYDELSSDKFAKTAPELMKTFLSHGEACTKMDAEALQLATQDPGPIDEDAFDSPMQVFNDALDKLDELQAQASELESSITQITEPKEGSNIEEDATKARSQLVPIFSACLPVIRARVANLTMAQELVEGAKQSLAMTLHLESLEWSDSD